MNEAPDDNDPWDLPELKDTGIKWSGEAACNSMWRTLQNFTLIQYFVVFFDRVGYKRKDYESGDWSCEVRSAAWTSLCVYLLTGCSQLCVPASRR